MKYRQLGHTDGRTSYPHLHRRFPPQCMERLWVCWQSAEGNLYFRL